MSKYVVLLLIFYASHLSASGLVGIGVSGRLQKDDANNFETKFPLSIFGGYKTEKMIYLVEGLFFENSSSSGSGFKVTTNRYEATVYALRFFRYEEARSINPYAVIGLGGGRSDVRTELLGDVDKDKSAINLISKAGLGAWANLGSRGFVNLEGKLLYSKDYSPDLIFDLAGRVGLEF